MRSIRCVMNISLCHHFYFSFFSQVCQTCIKQSTCTKWSVGHFLARDQAPLLGKRQKMKQNGIKQSASLVVDWGRGKRGRAWRHAFDAAIPPPRLALGSLCSTIFPPNCGAWSQPSHSQSRETALLFITLLLFLLFKFF